MKWRWLIPAAVAVFVCTLALRTPAADLVAWFMPSGLPLQVYGVDGTLHHGQVTTIVYHKRPVAAGLEWTLRPVWLLAGRVALHVAGGTDDLHVDGDVAAGLNTLRASGLQLYARLKAVAAAAGYTFVPVDGLLHVKLHDAVVSRSAIDALDAEVTLRGLHWSLGTKPLELGDFAAHAMRTDHGGVEAKITSTAGPLDVSGTATLSAQGRYVLDLKLRARPGAPVEVTNLLQALGRPDAAGIHRLHDTGQSPWPVAKTVHP